MKAKIWVEVLFIQQDHLNTMLSVQFVFCLTCLFFRVQTNNLKFHSVQQQKQFVSVKAGDSVTLWCFYEDVVDARFYWYKQNLGQKPKLISTYYKYETNGTFHDEFRSNPRFTLDTAKGKNHLKITNLSISDSATYYCASSYLYKLEFAEGTTVSVKDSGSTIQTVVHQSGPETVQSGGSVTLNCSVQTGACDGEHSVYWFKDTRGPLPSLIYTHGGRNDQCERKPNTPTHTCVFNLSVKNLNGSHVGTYYCAVASCGHILFGNGTQLDLKTGVDLVFIWTGALTSILSVLLAFSVCVMNKTNTCTSSAEAAEFSRFPAVDEKTNGSRRLRDPVWSQCVYNRVKM